MRNMNIAWEKGAMEMDCLVAVKRVIDFNVKVRIKNDGSAIETDHVKMSMNPFDEIALEEAIRLKEAGKLNTVTAISIGSMDCQETLRAALARGADRAILVHTDISYEPLNIAKILKHFVENQAIHLVFLGKQAIDDDCNQTGQMLSGLLGWSQGTNISKVTDLSLGTPAFINITRETDAGLESLQLTLPAVLTADLRLNEPRYIALPNLMKAKSKPLDVIEIEALIKQYNLDLKPHTRILKVTAPIIKRQSKKLNTVKELVETLKLKERVIK